MNFDPTEIGPEWEARITGAEDVLPVVRHLLDERVTWLVEKAERLEADLEELREEVEEERRQRRFQEAEDRGRREVLAAKLEKIRGYLDEFGDETLREILE